MPVDVSIDDKDLGGFSEPARTHFKKSLEEYAANLIREANRLEAARNTTGGPSEITQGMINDAVLSQRHFLGSPKKSRKSNFLAAGSTIFGIFAGSMYDAAALQNPIYMLAFIAVIIVTIGLITLSAIWD